MCSFYSFFSRVLVLNWVRRIGTPLPIQKVVCHALTGGLFAALSGQRQVALCTMLLEVGSEAISVSGFIEMFHRFIY